MMNGHRVLAVIPARGGSKRVPRKNLCTYKCKTLIEWAISHAKASKYIDHFVVSSEDKEILEHAGACGLLRPAPLATDDAKSEDVLRDALGLFPAHWVVLLQPTSPKRIPEDIDKCLELAEKNGNGCISTLNGVTNGAVYVATSAWLARHNFTDAGLAKYEMPEERSLDIDEIEDFYK